MWTVVHRGTRLRGWRGYLGLGGTRKRGNGKDYITRSFRLCTHQMFFGSSTQEDGDEQGM